MRSSVALCLVGLYCVALCGWVTGSQGESESARPTSVGEAGARPARTDVAAELRLAERQQFRGRPSRVTRLMPGARGFRDSGLPAIRGMTIGPIESLLQPNRGYGSERFAETLGEVTLLGGNWISLTVFSRVWDAQSVGIDWSFERPFEETRAAVIRSVQLAHQRGLRVMLVPHLWLESGEWRAEMRHLSEPRFREWVKNYREFALTWARVAEQSEVDLFSAGVELRSWVTSTRAHDFVDIIAAVRSEYQGLVTYAANWDDAADTMIWGHLDLIGINAFYPLHWEDDASWQQVEAGGLRVRDEVEGLSARWDKPVLFTEFGYTTRKNTEIQPWLWPEQLGEVTADPEAQARAYAALLDGMREVPGFAGAVVWRMYADVADLSQEPDWGFSPWGKPALSVLERVFSDPRFGDPPLLPQVPF